MGYHIICPQENGGFVSLYVEQLKELAMLNGITPDALVYEGEEGQTAWRLGSSKEASTFISDWYCAGMRAQSLFRELAVSRKLIVEEISQDQESFKHYTAGTTDSIKRGDFLIRNAKNVEVEVKCRTLNVRKDGATETEFYRIGYSEVKKLDAMQRITGIPILVAFFQRNGRDPVASSMKMIAISAIDRLARSKVVWYDSKNTDWCVPLSQMDDGFAMLDRVRESIAKENEVGGSWDAILNASREASARAVLIDAQMDLCKTLELPFFMPRDGICFSCRGDVVGRLGIELTKVYVTGCPLCARTYCD